MELHELDLLTDLEVLKIKLGSRLVLKCDIDHVGGALCVLDSIQNTDHRLSYEDFLLNLQVLLLCELGLVDAYCKSLLDQVSISQFTGLHSDLWKVESTILEHGTVGDVFDCLIYDLDLLSYLELCALLN